MQECKTTEGIPFPHFTDIGLEVPLLRGIDIPLTSHAIVLASISLSVSPYPFMLAAVLSASSGSNDQYWRWSKIFCYGFDHNLSSVGSTASWHRHSVVVGVDGVPFTGSIVGSSYYP